MEKFNLESIKNVLIIGSGHGIGLSLTETLLKNYQDCFIYTTYRDVSRCDSLKNLESQYRSRLVTSLVNPLDESSLEEFTNELSEKVQHLDLVINCVGVLHSENMKPEKSLNDISMKQLLDSFAINSIVTPLLAKMLLPLLRPKPLSVFASLSAKVGSINDNTLGGWYGYRASKSALNMFIKTVALEFINRKIQCLSLAIHPGTTQTDLSEPYLKHTKLNVNSPEKTALNILNVLNDLSTDANGKFLNWDGSEISW